MNTSLVCQGEDESFEVWAGHHCYHCGRIFGESDPTPGCICWTELDDEIVHDEDANLVDPDPGRNAMTTPYEDFLAEQGATE